MSPKPGQLIRITAVRNWTATNLTVGSVMVVGEDSRPPTHQDPDGYVWVQSPDYNGATGASGWVKYETLVLMLGADHEKIVAALKTAGVYNDGEPLWNSIARAVVERDSARREATRLQLEVVRAGKLAEEATERIKRLENEIVRLSSPPGTSFGWENGGPKPSQVYVKEQVALPEIGSWIKITDTHGGGRLIVGEVIQVGIARAMHNGDIWVSTGSAPYGQAGERYGYCKFERAAAPKDTERGDLHARVGRQRRELRRLNGNYRLMKTELELAQQLNDNLGTICLDLKRQVRALEAAIK